MTELKKSVTGVSVNIKSKIFGKAKEYSLERLVWCITAIFLCWTEVQNYHEYIFMLRMYVLSGIGAFYCMKWGFFAKGKRVLCGLVTLAGIYVTMELVGRNYYATYKYMNLPLGIFLTVLANLYVLVIWDAVKERRIPFSIGPSLILILMLLAKQTSVYDYKNFYLYILISLLPFVMMKKDEFTGSRVLNGMIDGICIGFFLIQGYAWMHRPYNYSAIRYTGISNECTTMSRIYLPFFAAWIIRYAQIARQKLNPVNGVFRVFAWLMAAFVLSLEYLTGSRSAVLAMILMTVITVAVRYMGVEDKRWKRIGKLLLWPVNCIGIGLVSLALFPVAFRSVRYLPAYFNEPVYVDAIGYRSDSVVIQKWGENFGWNYEYDEEAIKADEDIDSPKYVAFEEAVSHNLGRIIPGVQEFFESILADELLEIRLRRTDYYLEQGIYDQARHYSYTIYWKDVYSANNVTSDEKQNQEGNVTENMILRTYNNIVQMLLKTLVLHIEGEEAIAEASEIQVVGERGDSKEYPWFAAEEYPGNGMALRSAIHQYAIGKLNNEGHAAGAFCLWLTSEERQPHAHNIFLIAGYNFGIPTMILMGLLFVSTFVVSLSNVIRFEKIEYLLPALLIAGITVFGWFETGFDYKTGIMMWVFLSVAFTDALDWYKNTQK